MSNRQDKSKAEVRVRFAPSPTGYLHVGGARTALFDWLFARKHQGKFILRIEDTDVERSSQEMVEGILEGLRWLGLDWDEGPYFQSQRLALYRDCARKLVESGHAYYCYCTPEELREKRERAQKEKRPPKYDGTCRRISHEEVKQREAAGLPRAIRFKVPEAGSLGFMDHVFGRVEVSCEQIEDFVLLNSKNHPTYHLSVVVDDIDMRITHVVRGADHVPNTPKQILIYQALGLEPPEFAHLPLILGPDRSKLSKRHGTTSVTAYRDLGYLPDAFVNFLALLGWSPGDDTEIMSREELIERFSLDRINQANAIFDTKKLDWFNSQYISRQSAEALLPIVRAELEKKTLWQERFANEDRAWFLETIDLLKSRMRNIPDFAESGRAYFSDDFEIDEAARKKNLKDPALKELISALIDRFHQASEWTLESTEKTLREFAEERSVKAGLLINAVRTLVTGQPVGPPLFHILVQLGKEKTTQRLKKGKAL